MTTSVLNDLHHADDPFAALSLSLSKNKSLSKASFLKLTVI